MIRSFIIISVFLIISSKTQSEDQLFNSLFFTNELKNEIKFNKFEGVRLSGGNGSIAENVIREVIQIKGKIEFAFDGRNPAVILCQLYDGKHDFAYLSNGDQVPICGFKDKSFFVSWDLFETKV